MNFFTNSLFPIVACSAKHKKMTNKSQKPRSKLPVNGIKNGVLKSSSASLSVKSAYKSKYSTKDYYRPFSYENNS